MQSLHLLSGWQQRGFFLNLQSPELDWPSELSSSASHSHCLDHSVGGQWLHKIYEYRINLNPLDSHNMASN